ncbi:hypothetical protein VHEMI08384 [[Torrubiella] hemipterigena]|nr:hypothetical protein VHEMI08384 [[Torrubiella] hemipterigena]
MKLQALVLALGPLAGVLASPVAGPHVQAADSGGASNNKIEDLVKYNTESTDSGGASNNKRLLSRDTQSTNSGGGSYNKRLLNRDTQSTNSGGASYNK